jgi:hypothetical protein
MSDKIFYLYTEGQDRFPMQADDVGDGHHTMSELYEHRFALFTALIKAYDSIITPLGPTSVYCWKSRYHHDGTMFDEWFIAGISKRNLDRTETHITYHLPKEWWDKLSCIEIMAAPIWDGHTSKDVIQRLLKL